MGLLFWLCGFGCIYKSALHCFMCVNARSVSLCSILHRIWNERDYENVWKWFFDYDWDACNRVERRSWVRCTSKQSRYRTYENVTRWLVPFPPHTHHTELYIHREYSPPSINHKQKMYVAIPNNVVRNRGQFSVCQETKKKTISNFYSCHSIPATRHYRSHKFALPTMAFFVVVVVSFLLIFTPLVSRTHNITTYVMNGAIIIISSAVSQTVLLGTGLRKKK